MGDAALRLIFIIISGILVSKVAAESKQAVSMVFKDTVLINDTIIHLGDIAEINSSDNELIYKLCNVVAGVAAPAGYSRFLNADDLLLYRLNSQFNNVHFQISGCRRVIIKTDFIEKHIEDYREDIEEYFRKEVSWPEGCWEMKIMEPQRSWKCLNGSASAEIQGLQNDFPKGHVQVWLNVKQGNRKIRIPVSCNVKVALPVLVARKSIIRGQIISAGDCELKKMDITTFGPEPFSQFDVISGIRAARTINPGTILHARLIQSMPVVEKGDLVDILVSKGRVKVAVQGVARECGKVGEKIWVENAVSRKLIQTIIRSKGTVTVAQGGLSI